MKKYLNILVAICMAVTCLGAVPVWADENSSNNFKSLSVYVTDGYNPIEGASISISNQTATSGADGTAVFDAVPTSTDVYHMTVTHEDYVVVIFPSFSYVLLRLIRFCFFLPAAPYASAPNWIGGLAEPVLVRLHEVLGGLVLRRRR